MTFKLKKLNSGDKSKVMIIDEIINKDGSISTREFLCDEKSIDAKIKKLEEEVNNFKEAKNKIKNSDFDEEITELENTNSIGELEFFKSDGGTKIDGIRPERIKNRENHPNKSKKNEL